jgi:hypothetical protein
MLDTVTTIEAPDIIVEFVVKGFAERRYWEVWVQPDGSVEVYFDNGNSATHRSYGMMMAHLRDNATVTDII